MISPKNRPPNWVLNVKKGLFRKQQERVSRLRKNRVLISGIIHSIRHM